MGLETLRNRIARIEGRTRRFEAAEGRAAQAWLTGLDALDTALPPGGLAGGACHDVTPLEAVNVPATAAFVLALLKRLPGNGPLVWCQTAFNAREYGRLYGPGLMDAGVSPGRLIFVDVRKERDLPLVLEECLRVPKLAAVIGEGPAPDFTASRRLTLAAQESRVPCLIVNTSGTIGASAAATRWRIAPIAGPPDPLDPQGPGHPAWSVTLARSRGADAATNPTIAKPLEIFWNDAAHSFDLVPPLRDGAARPRAGATGGALHAG